MKTLPSMSGLLPAQFKTDPASVGIGWDTINQNKKVEAIPKHTFPNYKDTQEVVVTETVPGVYVSVERYTRTYIFYYKPSE